MTPTPKPLALDIRPLTPVETDACRICCRVFPKKPDFPPRAETGGIFGLGEGLGHRRAPPADERAERCRLRKTGNRLTAARRGAIRRDGPRASNRPAPPGAGGRRPFRRRRGRRP